MTSTLVKLSHIYTYTQESDGALYCRTRTGGKYRYQTRNYKKNQKIVTSDANILGSFALEEPGQ